MKGQISEIFPENTKAEDAETLNHLEEYCLLGHEAV
jgi:hypothetical protein